MKIAVIKLGAKGDVIRTLPIAEAIKKKYPNSELNWITRSNISELLGENPYIDKVISLPFKIKDKFDILYNLDFEEEASALAISIPAIKKYGFYFEAGFPTSFNLGAQYYLNTIFDDELKRTNRKTYQEMIFEAADLIFNKEKPVIYLSEKDKSFAEKFIKENKINKEKLIGLHMGAGSRWPSKAWSQQRIKEFITLARKEGYEILLFAGPDELDKIQNLKNQLKEDRVFICENNSNKEFASLVSVCQKVICSDSFALHLSLALNKPTIGLFFCTPPDEIEPYGLLKKIVSPMLYDFFPEKQDQYSEELVNSIPSDKVLLAL